MPNHESVTCPRCQKSFECKVGTINLCHCSEARLTQAQRDYVSQNWNECLCAACLVEIKKLMPTKTGSNQ